MSDVLSPPRPLPHTGPGIAAPPARPLSAGDLRLMAAWASDHSDTALVFANDGTETDPRITRVGSEEDAGLGVVVVPALGGARPGTLRTLTAWVDDTAGEVDAGQWSAAFWSESSVEKFLLPYLSSLAGGRAYQVLADVNRAWNRYPCDRRPFAFLHAGTCPEAIPLDLYDLVHVWYLDRRGEKPVLATSSLGEFLPGCDAPWPGPEQAVTAPYFPGTIGGPGARLPTALQLRRMGEWASEFRTEPRYFSFDTRDGQYEGDLPDLPEDRADRVVIPVFTPPTRPGRPVVVSMTLQPLEGRALPLEPRQGDAAFWRTGTVERIMIPYYASVYGGEALWMLGKIFDAWKGNPQGGTQPPRIAAAVAAAVAGTAADAEDLGPAAALIHLPKSDWEDETGDHVAIEIVRPGGTDAEGPAVGMLFSPGEPGGPGEAGLSARP